MPRLHPGSAQSKRFESDADTLPFPEGGVFGRPVARGFSETPISDASREAELTIERIQRQFDALRAQVDEVIFHIPSRAVAWRPPAA